MAKKLVRGSSRFEDAPSKKSQPKVRRKYVTIADLTDGGLQKVTCSCERVSAERVGTDVVIRGEGGWIQQAQWVTCGIPEGQGCCERIRIAPRTVWETGSGDRFTVTKFLEDPTGPRKVS